MLKLHEWNNIQKHITVLNNATDVCVSQELNKSYRLTFLYPDNDKGKLITLNRLIDCEGQFFRILRTRHTNDGQNVIEVTCDHVYYADGQRLYMESFGHREQIINYITGAITYGEIEDWVNASPTAIAHAAIDSTMNARYGRENPYGDVLRFSFLSTASVVENLGMQLADADDFTTDFFVEDKINSVEVLEKLIENIGKGEIYIDNYTVALVERIGADNGVRLELDRNLQNVTVERDMTELITRLYPYAPDDVHIGSITNEGTHYIDSPNISTYGVIAKHKNYESVEGQGEGDIAVKLRRMAEWEFSANNPNRIDVPTVSITGSLVDISKLNEYGDIVKVRLGDTVTVVDNGQEIKERVIALETYPYEPKKGSVTIGKVQKNLYFYMDQMRYKVNKLMKGR